MDRITSRDNQRLAAVRKVRDSHDAELMFIEGRRLAEEALRSGLQITGCFLSDDFNDPLLLRSVDAPVFQMPANIFKSVADTDSPQGIILIAKKRPKVSGESPLQDMSKKYLKVTLFLSEINNPSNLGAILRTAEASGVGGVFLSKGSTDPYSPKALRASMGSAFRIAINEEVSLEKAVASARAHRMIITGTDTHGSISYDEADWTKPRLLVFGSEAHGLGPEESSLIDETIRIPMASDVESLNLAVAAGIILFEARRQSAVSG